jgi:hypothetical protein
MTDMEEVPKRKFEGRLLFHGLIWRNENGYWRRYLVRQFESSKRYLVQELVWLSENRTPRHR